MLHLSFHTPMLFPSIGSSSPPKNFARVVPGSLFADGALIANNSAGVTGAGAALHASR